MPRSNEVPGQQPQEPRLEITEKLSPEEETMLKVFTEWGGLEGDLKVASHDRKEFSEEEADELTRQWYGFGRSHEGRTQEEYEALKKEVVGLLTLDFRRYVKDADYREFMEKNNPLFEKILADEKKWGEERLIHDIHATREKLGISEDQFKKILGLCDPEVQKSFKEQAMINKLLGGAFKKLTPEARTKLDNAIHKRMQRGLEERDKEKNKQL